MKTTTQTALRFREVFLNGTWIANTNYKDQLADMDWKTATTQFQNLNTIALLAQHIHYYVDGINAVFKGGMLDIKDAYSFDFAPITSQIEWERFLSRFWKDAEFFASSIDQMTAQQLQAAFVDEKYGNYQRNIDAMMEHAYYHLGQIVLIKKLIKN